MHAEVWIYYILCEFWLTNFWSSNSIVLLIQKYLFNLHGILISFYQYFGKETYLNKWDGWEFIFLISFRYFYNKWNCMSTISLLQKHRTPKKNVEKNWESAREWACMHVCKLKFNKSQISVGIQCNVPRVLWL